MDNDIDEIIGGDDDNWDCPCGCGNHGTNGGCPCGCASLGEHLRRRKHEVEKKKTDGGVVCLMLGEMEADTYYSNREMIGIFTKISASWEPANLTGHLHGRSTAGRYGKILIKDRNGYKVHSDFY
jgi:hypothetical protein